MHWIFFSVLFLSLQIIKILAIFSEIWIYCRYLLTDPRINYFSLETVAQGHEGQMCKLKELAKENRRKLKIPYDST